MNSGAFVSETLEELVGSSSRAGRAQREGSTCAGGARDAPSVSHLASTCGFHALICQVVVIQSGWGANR